ncbi:hypothetical protein [Paenibacillus sp. YN15]|uniref:hypothetical protein n=1 Tax=Paenibacillus sp. YN15 TaxID=1742774 RepID=UPI000DCBF753|nr:hypothetical protein [Paenibacillus sp. YN15]RAU97911.1 hypothetical protein DQG13_18185 [Paenibacillus sp. YN15]
MNFYIHNIKVNSIASIGSLNIGNTILTRNQSTVITQTTGDDQPAGAAQEAGALEPIGAGGAIGAVEDDSHGGEAEEESPGSFVQTQGSSYTPPDGPDADGIFAGEPPAWRRFV